MGWGEGAVDVDAAKGDCEGTREGVFVKIDGVDVGINEVVGVDVGRRDEGEEVGVVVGCFEGSNEGTLVGSWLGNVEGVS